MTSFVSPAALAAAREQYALMVAYNCAIGHGDAHLKNFSVLYRHAEDTVRIAPAYDIVSTLIYLPRDTLALTMDGSKEFPDRARLKKFVREVTGKTEKAAANLLEQVEEGVRAAIKQAGAQGKKNREMKQFTDRLVSVMRAGLARLA